MKKVVARAMAMAAPVNVAAVLLGTALLLGLDVRAQPLASVDEAYKALQARRYKDVEDLHERLLRERKRTPKGTYEYEEFQRSVYWYSSSDPTDGAYWPIVDAGSKDWVARSPGSHVAAMTRAYALAYRAGYLEARENNWVAAAKVADEAARLMAGSRAKGRTDPLWHVARLRVASVQALPRHEVAALIDEAVVTDATVLLMWREASIALTPDGSRPEDLVLLMRLALRTTRTTEGTSMYARVMENVLWRYDDFRARPPFGAGLDWNLLHDSFLDWKKRYPPSYPLDLHAAMACAARDAEVTATLVTMPGMPRSPETWKSMGGKDHFTTCRDWARTTTRRPTT